MTAWANLRTEGFAVFSCSESETSLYFRGRSIEDTHAPMTRKNNRRAGEDRVDSRVVGADSGLCLPWDSVAEKHCEIVGGVLNCWEQSSVSLRASVENVTVDAMARVLSQQHFNFDTSKSADTPSRGSSLETNRHPDAGGNLDLNHSRRVERLERTCSRNEYNPYGQLHNTGVSSSERSGSKQFSTRNTVAASSTNRARRLHNQCGSKCRRRRQLLRGLLRSWRTWYEWRDI